MDEANMEGTLEPTSPVSNADRVVSSDRARREGRRQRGDSGRRNRRRGKDEPPGEEKDPERALPDRGRRIDLEA
jgi:hypothetical protein